MSPIITTARTGICVIIFTLVSKLLTAQPGNNDCGFATSLTPVATCGATTGQTLFQATTSAPTSLCGTAYDAWYYFAVPTGVTSVNIAVTTGGGSNLDNTNTYVEAFNASTCGAISTLTTLGCYSI